MGNHISCVHPQQGSGSGSGSGRIIKVIKLDGMVKTYDRPVQVSQLMLEFPKHSVCRSDSFYIGHKIPALSQDHLLQLGHKYFLLPHHCFQTVLSFLTIASFIKSEHQPPSSSSHAAAAADNNNNNNNNLLKKAASNCQPFHIQKSPSGCLQIRLSDEFITQLMELEGKVMQEEESNCDVVTSNRVCTTPQLEKDYKQLVGSARPPWKPKLDTIKEKEKIMHKLSSFGRKSSSSSTRKKKSHHHHNSNPKPKPPPPPAAAAQKICSSRTTSRSSSDQHPHHPKSNIKPSSKHKIRFKIKINKSTRKNNIVAS